MHHHRVRLRRWFRTIARTLLDAAVPAQCPACGGGAPAEGLCPACKAFLEQRHEPLCSRCGTPLPSRQAACPDDHRRLQGLSFARAAFAYRGTGGALVRRLKFQHDRAALRYVARALAWTLPLPRHEARRAVLVSVPLHRTKRAERGFDQAAELAQELAVRLGIGHARRALVRHRATLPQADPRVVSRARNVEGAFTLRRVRAVRGRLVVLVDDVCTSGSTARECARALREGGAQAVALLTAAQA